MCILYFLSFICDFRNKESDKLWTKSNLLHENIKLIESDRKKNIFIRNNYVIYIENNYISDSKWMNEIHIPHVCHRDLLFLSSYLLLLKKVHITKSTLKTSIWWALRLYHNACMVNQQETSRTHVAKLQGCTDNIIPPHCI